MIPPKNDCLNIMKIWTPVCMHTFIYFMAFIFVSFSLYRFSSTCVPKNTLRVPLSKSFKTAV